MGDIFGLAKAVIVWLGPEDHLSNIAISSIARIDPGRAIREMGDDRLDDDKKTYFFDGLPENDANKQIVQALVAFFLRPWFRRIWTQQEAALCRHMIIMCGSEQTSWEQLISMI